MYNIRYLIISICLCVLFSCAPSKSIVERIDPPMDTIVPVRMDCKIIKRYSKYGRKRYYNAINIKSCDTIEFIGDEKFRKPIKEGKIYSLELVPVKLVDIIITRDGPAGCICIDMGTRREFMKCFMHRMHHQLYLLLENNGITPEKESED